MTSASLLSPRHAGIERRPHPLAGALAFAAKLLTGASARWVGSRPRAGPRVYFANHTSHLDFIVLWAALPREMRKLARPVAARDYWQRTALRYFVAKRMFGAVLIGRGLRAAPRDTVERLAAALDGGHSLIVFPEGTRGNGDQVLPFRSGLFHLARRRPDVELVPAYIDNLNRILPKGECLPVPLLCRVTFGPPLALDAGETKAEFLSRARAAVCELRYL